MFSGKAGRIAVSFRKSFTGLLTDLRYTFMTTLTRTVRTHLNSKNLVILACAALIGQQGVTVGRTDASKKRYSTTCCRAE